MATRIHFFFILTIIFTTSQIPLCEDHQIAHATINAVKIGQGVQGSAFQISPTEVVKILEVKEKDPSAIQAEREIKIMARLKHSPFAVDIFDACKTTTENFQRFYIFMENCESEFLDFLKEFKGSQQKFYDVLVELASIFVEVNALGVFHIDNQSENVMVCGGRLKLIDFGRSVFNRKPSNRRQKGLELMNLGNLFLVVRDFMEIDAPELDELIKEMKNQGIYSRKKIPLTLTIGKVKEKLDELAAKFGTKLSVSQRHLHSKSRFFGLEPPKMMTLRLSTMSKVFI